MSRPNIISLANVSRVDNWPRQLAARLSERPTNRGRLVTRGVTALVLLAAAPKCVLCMAGYWGIAAGLGAAGMELCGGTSTGSGLASWIALLPMGAASFALMAVPLVLRIFAFVRSAVRDKSGHSLNHHTTDGHPLQSATP